ncbi:MAG: sodium-translocating pyrophosphatase [Verrucomicrobiaceae bacterium]|nr:MAG: sodium-translocating pyrophosphatase [Verrucomicrobiaceae bacterium]
MSSAFLVSNGLLISLACAVFGLFYAAYLVRWILASPAGNDRMREIAAAVQQGAKAYLNRQIMSIGAIAVIIFALVWVGRGMESAVGFLVGAVCSLAAGYIGMTIAVRANVRTAQAATVSPHAALRVAFNGGAVTGLLVVGLALLSIGLMFIGVKHFSVAADPVRSALDALVGTALGSSLISVFARLGGGIYTKAADVGADLVGKIESKLDEDDPRNPATIADNVGDNVGDCAGMAADVFETYAVSLIGAILIGSLTVTGDAAALVYPFLLGGVSVVSAVIGILFVNMVPISPTRALQGGVMVSALLSAIAFWPLTHALFPAGVNIAGKGICTPDNVFFASIIGLVMTYVVLLITNYYTSTDHRPVRMIAKASETGHATNIIAGLATGLHATALPVAFIGIAILLSYHFAGLYGIAVAVMSMLSMSGIIIALDAFGPITDNSGGIAVMSGMDKEVRKTTDDLDAIGNTMKAVTKGYAIASAGLAALVLFGSYVEELKVSYERLGTHFNLAFDLQDPNVIIGLFIGGCLPFIFSAFSMDAVGKAAGAVVKEVRRQLAEKPGILTGQDTPDYGTCVDIVTKAALREMIVPAILPVAVVIAVAWFPFFGPKVLGGVLVGTIVTGLFMGIAMTSSGGAWDNAKKFIELGNLGGKGSPAHDASVTGDTVGDPYKDTAGPAVNPMIKVVNIVAILIIPIFIKLWVKG